MQYSLQHPASVISYRLSPKQTPPIVRNELLQFKLAIQKLVSVWRTVLEYLIGWRLLNLAIIAPATGWLLEQLLTSKHPLAISNYDLIQFALSPRGMLFIMFSGTLTLLSIYLEQTGLTFIALQRQNPGRLRTSKLVLGNLRHLPSLFKLGSTQFLILIVLFLPFAAVIAMVYLSLLKGKDINFFLATNPREWRWAVTLTLICLLGYLLLSIFVITRWFYAIPHLLSNPVSPIACLKISWRDTYSDRWKLIRLLGSWWVGTSIAISIASFLLDGLSEFFLSQMGMNMTILPEAIILIKSTYLIGGIVSITAVTTIHQFLVIRLFREKYPQPAEGVTPDTSLHSKFRSKHFYWLVVGVLLVAFLIASFSLRRNAEAMSFQTTVDVTAHRGSSGTAPENTMSALRQAIDDGADFAEIDVQTTKDGKIVIVHDADFLRVAGNPIRVENSTYAELAELDIGTWFSPEFEDERLPTLEEVIALCREKIKLNIELKYNRADPTLVPKVLRIIHDQAFEKDCIITSLSAGELQRAQNLAPDIPMGLIVAASLGNITRTDTNFLSLNMSRINHRFVRSIQDLEKEVHVWTVNSEADMLRMIEMGVDNIVTDYPAKLVTLKSQLDELNDLEHIALSLKIRFSKNKNSILSTESLENQ